VGDVTDILLVGQDQRDSEQLLWALDIHGMARRTKVARVAQEALDCLAHTTPRLILLDIASPASPGIEVLSKVKAHPTFRTIPIVALSRSADPVLEAELTRAGVNSVVVPPHTPDKLREVMGHVALYWMLVNRPAFAPMPAPAHQSAIPIGAKHSEPLRILIADRSLAEAEPAITALEEAGYRLSVELVTQLDEFVQCITELEYDVIIAEPALLQWGLADAVAALRKHDCLVPLIVVTGAPSAESMREAFAAGAQDYIRKDHLAHLPTAVARMVQQRATIAADKEERQRAAVRAERQDLIVTLLTTAWEESDPTVTIEEAVRRFATAASADACAYFELRPTDDQLFVRAGLGWREGVVGRLSMDAYAGTVLGFALGQEPPVVVTDFYSDHRFSAPPLLSDHRIRSGLCVTVGGDAQRDVGVLGLFSKAPGHFSQDDEDFAREISQVLTLVFRRLRADEAPRLLEHMAANLDRGIMILGRDGHGMPDVLYVNPAFTGLTGVASNEVVGIPAHHLLHHRIRRSDRVTMLKSLRNEGRFTGDLDFDRVDGTSFRATVSVTPLATREATAARWLVEARPTAATADRRPTASETILLVEQEETIRVQVADILTRYGYTVLATCNAAEAMHRASAWEGRLDLLLTELAESGISGPQLVEQVRARQPEVNVLFISKYRDLMLALPDMPEERVGWLHKPFPDEELLAGVRRLLAIRREEGQHGL
jgi:PAS domain S-box-containing protein